MTVSKLLFLALGVVLLALGVAGIVLPVLPATPFLLGASFCFLKSSNRLYRWIMANRLFGPRIERIRSRGLTGKEKLSIYLFACALIIPIIVLTPSPHLRIFLIALLAIKGIVFLRLKTAPGKTTPARPE
ncbi:MAG: YbaN family protein [Treponema sp.]|nr:YbaN family protein [Treponema sp.]